MSAVYFLESCLLLEEKAKEQDGIAALSQLSQVPRNEAFNRVTPPTSLLKNTGLAHLHLMKNKLIDTVTTKTTLPVSYHLRFELPAQKDDCRATDTSLLQGTM